MSKIVKTTIGLMIVTMLSKGLGFARELVLTYFYGATEVSDIYIASSCIPTTLFASIGTAILTVFIPLFYELDKKNQREESIKFTNNVFNIVIIITIIVSIFGYIFAEPLVKLFAIEFSGEKLEMAVSFTRIMIFGLIFIGLSNMMTAWLQINGNFTIPGMLGLPFNLSIMLGIIISSKGNINIMAIGTLIAMITQFLFQLPFAVNNGYRYKLYVNLKDEYLKKVLMLITPVFIGVGVSQINSIVDRSLASTLGDGIITVLNSANMFNTFVLVTFISTISAVIYPNLSRLSNDGNKSKFVDSITKSINAVVILIIPISIGTIVLANPVVKIIFERGAFDSYATNMTSIALKYYSIGMLGFSLRDILSKIFYSLQDTKTPMVNGFINVVMNMILNIILIRFLGYKGLVLATSISATICIVFLFDRLKKNIGYFGQDKIINTMYKSFLASTCMGVITRLTYNLYDNIIIGSGFIHDVVVLLGSIIIGVIVYIVIVALLKVEEMNIVLKIFKSKLNRNFEYNNMKKAED